MILKILIVLFSLAYVVYPGRGSPLSAVRYPGGRNNRNSTLNSTVEFNEIRIIGGVETDEHEFPFIVSFSRQGRHFCGGSIISPEWVLSAAHCASEPDFTVTAGEHNLQVPEGMEQVSRAMNVIRHPDYQPLTYENDICLVKVSPPFALDEKYVRAFAVPSTHYVAVGNATVAGWGTEDEAYQVVSPVLRKVTIPLVDNTECAYQYQHYFKPLKMICAGLEEGGKDACQGDSGGPLMCDDYHKGATLCGVVSFGFGCARPELAGVYTKVAHYSDWIEYEMKRNSGGSIAQTRRTTPYIRNNDGRTTPYPVRNHGRTTPPPPPPPKHNHDHNHLPHIPPGYEVIIKPIQPTNVSYGNNHNHGYPPPETGARKPAKTRGRGAAQSAISSSSVINLLLALALGRILLLQ